MKNAKADYNIYTSERAPALGPTLRPGGTALTARALDFCAFPAGAALLDIGCGAGATLALARERSLSCLGIDHSVALLEEARRAGLGPFVQNAPAGALPFPDGRFHGAFLECCLSAMGPRAPVLTEAHRILRGGGRLILSDLFLPAPLCGDTGPLPLEGDWAAHGFAPLLEEDHTAALRSFYAQMVFELGSRAAADGAFACCPPEHTKQLSYRLLVLEKCP